VPICKIKNNVRLLLFYRVIPTWFSPFFTQYHIYTDELDKNCNSTYIKYTRVQYNIDLQKSHPVFPGFKLINGSNKGSKFCRSQVYDTKWAMKINQAQSHQFSPSTDPQHVQSPLRRGLKMFAFGGTHYFTRQP